MKNVQQLFWTNTKNKVSIDTLFWKLPADKFPFKQTKNQEILILESLTLGWDETPSVNIDEWSSWFDLPHVYSQTQDKPRFYLEIRKKSIWSDELRMSDLRRRWLQQVWAASSELRADRGPEGLQLIQVRLLERKALPPEHGDHRRNVQRPLTSRLADAADVCS
jgi:hypothetical protein